MTSWLPRSQHQLFILFYLLLFTSTTIYLLSIIIYLPMFEETETHIFLVFFSNYLLSIIIYLPICEETETHILPVFFAIIFVNINTMAQDNIITMEEVEKMNLQVLKVHLENFGLSTSCEGAGRGGS